MPHSFTCQNCGKIFERIHKGYKYCSNRCAYDQFKGRPSHPNCHKKRTKKPARFICQHCGEPFERLVYPGSRSKFEFCGPACRNKARKLEKKPCPICGKLFIPRIIDTGGYRRRHCSKECADFSRRGEPSPRRTPEEIRRTVAEIYPTQGPEPLMEMFGLSKDTIRQIAYNEGVKLTQEALRNRVYKPTSERMKRNNPMHNPDSLKKVRDYYLNHPDEWEYRLERLTEGKRKLQKDKPTKLELRLLEYLDELGIDYEAYYLIKPKFVVDVRIGNLIIQADGDYWHGHPRLGPLTERQIAQQRRDKAQDKYLSKCGYTVVRIWESDMSKEAVIKVLKHHGISGGLPGVTGSAVGTSAH